MTIYGDWYNGESYKTTLMPNERRARSHIKQIERKIMELRSLHDDFVVVDLRKENGEPDIPVFFQTIRRRAYAPSFTERYGYDVELGVPEADGNRLFTKRNVDCAEVIRLFYDVCVNRKVFEPEEWERGDTVYGEKHVESRAEEKKLIERYKTIMNMFWNGKIEGALGDAVAMEACEELSNCDTFYDYAPTLIALYNGYGLYENIKTLFEQCSYDPNIANAMGDITYYGKLGQPDLQAAYDYYVHAGCIGSLRGQYNSAKAFRDGWFRTADPVLYEAALRRVYDFYIENHAQYALLAITDIILELSRIEEANADKALEYCLLAKKYEEAALSGTCFPTEKTEKIMLQLYKLTEFDSGNMKLLDLLYVLKKPCAVSVSLKNEIISLEAVPYEDEVIVKCGTSYYRNALAFFEKYRFKGERLTAYSKEIDYIIMEETR